MIERTEQKVQQKSTHTKITFDSVFKTSQHMRNYEPSATSYNINSYPVFVIVTMELWKINMKSYTGFPLR